MTNLTGLTNAKSEGMMGGMTTGTPPVNSDIGNESEQLLNPGLIG